MSMATVGARYQIVIPLREREKLGLKPHSQVLIEFRNDHLLVQPVGGGRARGIGAELRDGQDATAYIRKLRAEWADRS